MKTWTTLATVWTAPPGGSGSGQADPIRGEIVSAHLVLKPSYTPSAELKRELTQFVRLNLSTHSFPREINFVDQLPKTPSGKIRRFMLRG